MALLFGGVIMQKNIAARTARWQSGMRLIDLSVRTLISESRLSRLENGLVSPRPDEAARINGVFGREVFPVEKGE